MNSTGVNRPTDVKTKEADVNRKLQFYGIATAFSAGKVPSNSQIDIALNSFLASSALKSPSNKLSPEGRALTEDFRNVVEQAKHLLLSKNQGNLLQDFIWQSQHIDGGNAAIPGAPIDKNTAKQHGNDAVDGLRTLGTLLISNGQFRKLLNDAVVLARDIAGDAASKAANKVNPSDEQLSQIDKPADDNTWHDNPDMSSGNIKNQIKSTYQKNTPLRSGDLKDAAGNASEAANPNGSRDPADAANLAAKDQKYDQSSGVDGQAGLSHGAATLKQRASENIDDETKDKARDRRDRTKNYLSSKMPEERREQTIWRLKKMVVECQGHPDYQQAINTLLNLAEEYAGHATTVGNAATGTVKGAHGDSNLKTAESDLKTLIERFANGTSTNDLFDSINAIYRDADRDPELKNWFKSMNTYIRKCLKEQGYILEDSATQEWNGLYDRGNFLLRDRYRNHTDRVVDEVQFIASQFDKDPQNKRFADSINKFFNDLGKDENGSMTFKPHLLKDLTDVILPSILENISYVPIPRIEYSDPMMDCVVENLIIESDNLTPNVFEIATDNYKRWGRKTVGNKSHHAITVSVAGIQMDLRDVSFYVKKKQGFPSVTDLGVADIFLGGNGFSFKLGLSSAEKTDKQNFFKVDKVDVDVKNFNIKLKQSKHKLLFALAKPIMLKVIRPALQKVLEKQIRDQVHQLDSLLYQVKLEADRAKQDVKDNPEQAQNIYQRYASAAQKNFLQGKKKAENVAADKKVNVAMTKQDSIFPNIHLPGGISSKATEYKELALKGNNWESPIFKLGSASESSNITAAPTITRKDHSVTQGGIRGPDNIGQTESVTKQLHDPAAQSSGIASHNTSSGNPSYNTSSGNPSYNTSSGIAPNNVSSGNASYNTSSGIAPNNASSGVGGFGNQIDNAFSKEGTPVAALNGNTNASGLANGGTTHTTFGANNPVMTGRL